MVIDHLIPTFSIGKVRVPRLILGHLPFLGESYQGPSKNTDYNKKFSDIKNIEVILKRSIEKYSLNVFSAPTYTDGPYAPKIAPVIQSTITETKMSATIITIV